MATVLSDDQAKRHISENVRALLAERGWTQAQLASVCNESEMRISWMVRGLKIPSASFIARIAEAFGVTVDDLLGPPKKLQNTG